MELQQIISSVDHTLLNQTAVWEEVKQICEDAACYHTASVCIPPAYVKQAAEYLKGRIPVCTVIGFPNGYQTTAVKAFETEDALNNGAAEIDMVINLGWLKEKKYRQLEEEIKQLKGICGGRILKVIVETCLLTETEKIEMCRIVTSAGADYIKTSTGFSTGGATLEDVELFAKHVGKDVKIKASGGIGSLEDARRFLALGASRLGTSRIIRLLKEQEGR